MQDLEFLTALHTVVGLATLTCFNVEKFNVVLHFHW